MPNLQNCPHILWGVSNVFAKSYHIAHDSPAFARKASSVRSFLFLLILLVAARYALYLASCLAASYHSYHYETRIFDFHVLTGAQHIRTELDFTFDTHELDEDAMFCDRSNVRTDICQMNGDVRTDGKCRFIFLFTPESSNRNMQQEERIRPYTRKWESSVMATVDEITLKRANNSSSDSIRRCDVVHNVPAVVFSTGGYTGNVYHEFNDGLIPLFITSQHLKGEVVFVVLEYHHWWMTKYNEIVKRLTHYPLIDFNRDARIHCFPHVTVGLQIHDELRVNPKLMPNGESMRDFQSLMRDAYAPRLQPVTKTAPKLVIVAREHPRALLNQEEIVKLAKEIGFDVEVLFPVPTMEMVDIYRALNACDVMVGVHGAAMTHFLFMRPGSIFIQVVPLGTDWAAWTYYGEPATKLGLDYEAYRINLEESTLSDIYREGDVVLTDPDSINKRGWWETKRVYLDGQDVRLSMARFNRTLQRAHRKCVRRVSFTV